MQELKTIDTLRERERERERELYFNKLIKIEVIGASICDRKIKQTIIV